MNMAYLARPGKRKQLFALVVLRALLVDMKVEHADQVPNLRCV
jgi:hypothetical protein